MPAFIDLTGQKFSFLTVISRAPNHGKQVTWHCICKCGNKTESRSDQLKNGDSTSCGCEGRKRQIKAITSHGLCKSPEYKTWNSMLQRCGNPKSPHYHRYGGRGISVCAQWLKFDNFIADMGARPTSEHTIDRIDNDGNYAPENCKWSTRIEQMNNTSVNRFLTYNGETLTYSQWDKRLGFNASTVRRRICVHGWSIEKTITTPIEKGKTITHNGETLTVLQWSKRTGISRYTIRDRLDLGWDAHKILNTQPRKAKTLTHGDKTKTIKEWSIITGIKETTIHGRIRTGWTIADALNIKHDCRFLKT